MPTARILPASLQTRHHRRQHVRGEVVARGPHPVEMVDVHVVRAQSFQARVESRPDGARRIRIVRLRQRLLGRQHHAVPWNVAQGRADDLFGAIGLRGVEQVHAEVQRLSHEVDGMVRAHCRRVARAGSARRNPSPTTLTLRPVLPRFLYFIKTSACRPSTPVGTSAPTPKMSFPRNRLCQNATAARHRPPKSSFPRKRESRGGWAEVPHNTKASSGSP